MKFCPKCSLKIKGNVTRCPICKVELLSCAEDDERTARASNADNQKHEPVDVYPTPSTGGDAPDAKAEFHSKTTKPQGATGDPSDDSKDAHDANDRLEKLENGFKEMDSKLNNTIRKSDGFIDSAANLESRITKAEQALDQLKHSLETPGENIQQAEKEISKLTLHINHILKDLESIKSNVANLEAKLETPSSSFEDTATPRDVPIDKAALQEDKTSFRNGAEDDFENEFDIHTPPSREEIFDQPEPARRRSSLMVILILLIIVVTSWLGFSYFRSRTHESDNERIAKTIEISPILKNDVLDAEKGSANTEQTPETETAEMKPTDNEVLPSRENDARITTKVTNETSIPLEQSKSSKTTFQNASGYTVNVGSFKDKNRALALTKKLREKGYSAIMSASENKKMYRVRVGAFSSFNEALSYSTTLEKKEKLPTFIARINMP